MYQVKEIGTAIRSTLVIWLIVAVFYPIVILIFGNHRIDLIPNDFDLGRKKIYDQRTLRFRLAAVQGFASGSTLRRWS